MSKTFENVSVHTKANLYFDAKVISHTIVLADGSKKTLGVILPGKYYFGVSTPERMEITSGTALVKIDGSSTVTSFSEGSHFDIGAGSGFDIEVTEGSCEYICSYIPAP